MALSTALLRINHGSGNKFRSILRGASSDEHVPAVSIDADAVDFSAAGARVFTTQSAAGDSTVWVSADGKSKAIVHVEYAAAGNRTFRPMFKDFSNNIVYGRPFVCEDTGITANVMVVSNRQGATWEFSCLGWKEVTLRADDSGSGMDAWVSCI